MQAEWHPVPECAPHLIDVGGESEAQGIPRDWLAGFETRGTEGEVHLNLVSVVATDSWTSGAGLDTGFKGGYVLYLLKHVAHGDDYAGDGRPAKHTHDRNCRTDERTQTVNESHTHCIVLASRRVVHPWRSGCR